jgi:anti-anti-sigma factor
MKRNEPLLGEEHITRADDAAAQARKARGHLIDDALSTEKQPNTWDDFSAGDSPDPVAAASKLARPHGAQPAPVRPKTVPVASAGPALKKANIEGGYSDANISTIDWLPINSGHGLRINICGTLDQNLRSDWRRLLEEVERSGVGQFEFNLTETPTLTFTGLGLLLLFKEQKGSERGDIKLCHCNKEVRQMLQWTGMDRYFTIQGVPGS